MSAQLLPGGVAAVDTLPLGELSGLGPGPSR